MAAEQPFVHRVRVRYGEVDMQQVVFNAHYLAYCDDAADLWFQAMGLDFGDGGWDVMVKKAGITWSGGARARDELDIAVQVSRWGNTSFDVRFTGTVAEAPIFEAELTYVVVKVGTKQPMRVPDDFRALAGGPAEQ